MLDQKWIETFREEIPVFAEKAAAFDRGEIDRKDYKGVSGGFGSYAQKDPHKHMLRLRMAGGALTPERLAFLAEAAAQGVDTMKLTTCETVQLHNLSAAQVPSLMAQAIGAEIFTRAGGGDNPRNVMASPLSGVQPGEAFDVLPYAQAAGDYLLSICRDIRMPRKLKVAFCNGVDDCVHAAFRDMGFTAQPDGTFSLRIAGGLGVNPRMGVLVLEALPAGQILYAIRAMVETFCQHGCYTNRARARTRYMQETLGAEGLKAAYLENFQALLAKGGLDCAAEASPIAKAGEGEISGARVTAQKQPGLYAVAYHPIGGCLPVEKPAQLSALLAEMPGVSGRVAPYGTLYFINLTAAEAKRLLDATADSAATRFEGSVACIGAAICQQGVRDSQAVLRACVEAVREAGLPDGALPAIAICGCPSSCAAPQSAAIGFMGAVKVVDKKPMPAFKMTLNGSDALGAARFGEEVGTVLESDLPALLVELGKAAAADGWDAWFAAHSDQAKDIIARYL